MNEVTTIRLILVSNSKFSNFMKILAILALCIGLFAFSCEDKVPKNTCISGKIVGQKCDVFALQLDEEILGATEWQKWEPSGKVTEKFSNVIGLINLPEEFRIEGRILFVSLRKPTKEESNIPCYLDLPGPPAPFYVVINANETNCSETDR